MTVISEATSSVEFQIHDVPESFVLCRTLGHAWNRVTIDARANTAVLSLQCSRCKTRRTDQVDRRGALDRRSYDYPDGYQHKGVQIDRHEYRYELIVRARKQATPS